MCSRVQYHYLPPPPPHRTYIQNHKRKSRVSSQKAHPRPMYPEKPRKTQAEGRSQARKQHRKVFISIAHASITHHSSRNQKPIPISYPILSYPTPYD
jgi:hypothetical protein